LHKTNNVDQYIIMLTINS